MVQAMALDARGGPRHDAVVLGDAIRKEMARAGVNAAELARRLDVSESTISRLAAGQVQDVTVDRLVQIEHALGTPRGRLFRTAGLVDDRDATVHEVIESDPLLTADELRFVIRTYESAVAASAAERKRSSVKATPTKRNARRS
jgi:transcriptional regulator with XRE-family HTH domain